MGVWGWVQEGESKGGGAAWDTVHAMCKVCYVQHPVCKVCYVQHPQRTMVSRMRSVLDAICCAASVPALNTRLTPL